MGNRLKKLREEKGLTLDDIENITGIKRGTFNNYENGKTEPKLSTWGKLAVFFDVPVSYLMGLTDDKNDYKIEREKYFDTKWDYIDLGKFQRKFQDPTDFAGAVPKVALNDKEKSLVENMTNRFTNMIVGESIPYLVDEKKNKALVKVQRRNLDELEYLVNFLNAIVTFPFSMTKNGVIDSKDRLASQKVLLDTLKEINSLLKDKKNTTKNDVSN